MIFFSRTEKANGNRSRCRKSSSLADVEGKSCANKICGINKFKVKMFQVN